jgi:hypothetical protein
MKREYSPAESAVDWTTNNYAVSLRLSGKSQWYNIPQVWDRAGRVNAFRTNDGSLLVLLAAGNVQFQISYEALGIFPHCTDELILGLPLQA